MPQQDFSAAGLAEEIARHDLSGCRILRLRSARAPRDIALALKRVGAHVDDRILYDNRPVAYDAPPPPREAIFFASASAVEVFLAHYGAAALAGKTLYVIGRPTRAALPAGHRRRAVILPLW
jgi:uroporphyrinogen-III synthase